MVMLCKFIWQKSRLHCSRLFNRLEHDELNRHIHNLETSYATCSRLMNDNRCLSEWFKSGQYDKARQLFDKMVERDGFSWNTVVAGYSNLGRYKEARKLLVESPYKSSITYSSLISGYCRHGFGKEAYEILWQMQYDGFQPTEFTLGSVLGMCSKWGWLQRGEQLHCFSIKTQLETNVYVSTSLIDMYAKCNSVFEAENIFERVSTKNSPALWSSILAGYSYNRCEHKAMVCFRDMLVEGFHGNEYTYPTILTACAAAFSLCFGKQVHGCIIKSGSGSTAFIESALVDMYSKCGDLVSARIVLESGETYNLVSWNCMIVGCTREGLVIEAFSLFKSMHSRNMMIDEFTYPTIISSLAFLKDMRNAKSIHCLVIRSGHDRFNLVSNALVHMYANLGNMGNAIEVFSDMSECDIISWTSLVTGYVHNSFNEEALKLFNYMRSVGICHDGFISSSIICAIAELTVLDLGHQLHADVIKSGLGSALSVNSALVSMYAKCGCIKDANRIFDSMQRHNLISWTSLIVGYARNGQGKESIKLYEKMIASGVRPDSVTFIGLLFACNHLGLVETGQYYFKAMDHVYEIKPSLEHYSCMIDLFGRFGKLAEAKKLLNEMEVQPGACVWKALLSACRFHGDIELAERAANNLFLLEPLSAVPYVLLANMYTAAGRRENAARIRRLMKSKGITKEPGRSWLEMHGKVHSFVSGDGCHIRITEIYAKVDEIIYKIKKAGYVPDLNFALQDMEEKDKELGLARHSEKLAVAFALLTSSMGAPIRIYKNIRVCGDCHTAMKFISEVFDRYIVLRDSNCFHHFREGICSCKDYW